jgi:hypothetical protein
MEVLSDSGSTLNILVAMLFALLYLVGITAAFKEYFDPEQHMDAGKQKNVRYSNRLIINDPAVTKRAPVTALLEVRATHNRAVMDATTCEYGKRVEHFNRNCPAVILGTIFGTYDGEVLPPLESLDSGRQKHLLQAGKVKMV